MIPVPLREILPDEQGLRQPGDFYFITEHSQPTVRIGIVHACPCGCNARCALFFRGMGNGRPEWDVQGDWPNVTLNPSIGIRFDGDGNHMPGGTYHWHGYIRDGHFVEC